MKVLWICNLVPAWIAARLKGGRTPQNKEGWIAGALQKVIEHGELELAIAFPRRSDELLSGKMEGVRYYSFYEDGDAPEDYDPSLEGALGHICEEFTPDVIHCYGTEYPHTLAVLKLPEWRSRVLVHLQGIMSKCAEVYDGGLPEEVMEWVTMRDFLRRDALWQQREKYYKRAEHETEALELASYVSGRTAFDQKHAAWIHPSAKYFAMNETLRASFYQGQWERREGSHRIFLSQGNIPLKGAHTVIAALARVRERFPDAMLAIAGDDILRGTKLRDRLRLSGYGKYLRQLIAEYGLEDAVRYVGQQTEEEMREQYLSSDVYVLASVMENSPNSLGEAMLLGLPCVTSEVGGVSSLAEDGKEALLYPAGDAEALAERILRVFEDRELASELSAAARKRAALTHDPEANYKMLCWIYETIAKETER